MLEIVFALGFWQVISPTLATVGFYCTSERECEYYITENINSVCIDGFCHCYNNKTFLNTECRPKVIRTNNIIGGFCPCSLPHAECNKVDQICYCETGYIPIEGNRRCILEEVSLGNICEIDKQCMELDVFSHCAKDTKKCICNDGFYQSNTTCFARTKLQPKCTDSLQCMLHGQHLVCLPGAGECVCEPGFVSSNTTDKCIPARSYMQECDSAVQCQSSMGTGGICVEGKCSCGKGYEMIEKKRTEYVVCKQEAVIGQYCRTHEHCHNGHKANNEQLMHCDRSECVCRFGMKNQSPCSLSAATGLIANKLFLWSMVFFVSFFEF
ncbi:multiple epidermal growth factor-like domains protein 10 [Eurosta solidaginis]|uniref:multiple epidermal growth factor-like domains protein 10 n=1 Tax=Eurosta solidaginis TaxID=178769 RepID=UPI0035312694